LSLSIYIGESIRSKDLEDLIKLSAYNKRLDSKYLEILNYLLEYPNITAYDIWKVLKDIKINGKKPDKSSVRRDCKHLLDLRIIEISREDYTSTEENRDRKPYRLSLNGIFYIILNNYDGFYNNIVISLLKNYGSNILFVIFLYPYISQKVLLDLSNANNNSIVFYTIFPYLKNVCNTIINSSNSLKTLIYTSDHDDKYLLYRLFMWPLNYASHSEIPFEDKKLRNFIKMNLNWNWIDTAKITARYNDNVIDIVDPSNNIKSTQIFILPKDSKAILIHNGEKKFEFILTLNEMFLSVDIKTPERKIDFFVKFLVNECNDHLTNFLVKIKSKLRSMSQVYEFLLKDESFARTMKELDKIIDIH
jgi:hypothetical protein